MIFTLDEAIAAFRAGIVVPRGWDSPEHARNCCGAAAWAFETLLINCTEVAFTPYGVAVEFADSTVFHVMTQVGDVYLDWTARQFLPEAPVPAIFTRRMLDELGWRDLTEAERGEVLRHERIHRKWIEEGCACSHDSVQ